MTGETRILLVDDHSIMRAGLRSLLETQESFTVVGEAGTGRDAVSAASRTRPDVIVMDLMMPDMDGVETTRRILADRPGTNILILTTFGSADGLSHALESGARGAILKSAALDELLSAIRAVGAGTTYVSPEIRQIIRTDPPVPELTARQREILHSVTRGLTNEDIAHQLRITLAMVKEHLADIFTKIGAANRAEAVAIALRKHLLKI